jgi:hypothetical protein
MKGTGNRFKKNYPKYREKYRIKMAILADYASARVKSSVGLSVKTRKVNRRFDNHIKGMSKYILVKHLPIHS